LTSKLEEEMKIKFGGNEDQKWRVNSECREERE